MKLNKHVSIYITSVLVLTTVLIANNQINKSKIPATVPTAQSQQALSDTTVKTTETAPTNAAAPTTTTDTTVKSTTKASTVSTPKTTVKASTATTTTTPAVTETPTEPAEPVTPPQPTEEERVYKAANVDASKISSNSPYTISVDKLSVPDFGHINIQVNPIQRYSAEIIVYQVLSNGGMIGENTQGSWLLNTDNSYSDTYKDNVGIAFNGGNSIKLYVFIKLKDGTFYQHKYTLTKN